MQYQNHAVLGILTTILISTLAITSTGSINVWVQGQNMSGMVSEESYGNAAVPDKG